MSATRNSRQRVDVDGGWLHVERFGQGPPLLMVHGWALDRRMFRPQWRALSSAFEVIVFDRRGFGLSTAPPDLRRETDDLDLLLDALSLERVHLLGVSQGGRIALRYATGRADRLRSLVVQGAAVDGFSVDAPDAERIPIDEFVALARSGDLQTLRARWSAHPMMCLAGASRENRELLRDIVADYEARDLVAFDPAHYAWPGDVLAELASFPRPALLLTGALETEARKAHAAKLLLTLPDVRERVLAHSGHLSNLTEPDAWNETVRAFCLGAEAF